MQTSAPSSMNAALARAARAGTVGSSSVTAREVGRRGRRSAVGAAEPGPVHQPPDVGVHHRMALPVRERRDRPGGVRADAGQAEQRIERRAGTSPCMLAR